MYTVNYKYGMNLDGSLIIRNSSTISMMSSEVTITILSVKSDIYTYDYLFKVNSKNPAVEDVVVSELLVVYMY